MKYLALILVAIACSPKHKEIPDYLMPPELKDCKVFMISDGGINGKELYVVHCPKAITTTSWDRSCGKTCTTTEHVTVEGL